MQIILGHKHKHFSCYRLILKLLIKKVLCSFRERMLSLKIIIAFRTKGPLFASKAVGFLKPSSSEKYFSV